MIRKPGPGGNFDAVPTLAVKTNSALLLLCLSRVCKDFDVGGVVRKKTVRVLHPLRNQLNLFRGTSLEPKPSS